MSTTRRRMRFRRQSTRYPAPRTTQERGTIGVVGAISAVAGFFELGIVLGPLAMVCGWIAMRGRWRDGKPTTAVIALALGAIDTLLALLLASGGSLESGAL